MGFKRYTFQGLVKAAFLITLITSLALTTKYAKQWLYFVTSVSVMIASVYYAGALHSNEPTAIVLDILLFVWGLFMMVPLVIEGKRRGIQRVAFYLRPLSIMKEGKVPTNVTPVVVSPVPGSPHMSSPVHYPAPSPVSHQVSSQTHLVTPRS